MCPNCKTSRVSKEVPIIPDFKPSMLVIACPMCGYILSLVARSWVRMDKDQRIVETLRLKEDYERHRGERLRNEKV